MTPFELRGPLPRGTTVLEASAGTGKTATIAALTVRYVAEGAALLSELLLVTFGNAASRELRDRVRERLVGAERALRDPASARSGGDELLRLLGAAGDEEVARRRDRLVRALAGFDAATIATTHSFCSQVLAALGTAADAERGAVFTERLDDLVAEVVDDLYLQTYARPGAVGEPSMSHPELLELGRRAVADRAARLVPETAEGVPAQRRAAAQAVRDEVERRKRRSGTVDYDDWLVLLRAALADPEHGAAVCERVRARYRVVLVDEFQDTDPVQWDVLRLAFHGHRTLVLIGDPKQAIYAFRGGDVTTYLAASSVAGSRATLPRNWRSDGPLLLAFEQLLGQAALGDERIVVRAVEAAHAAARITCAGAPLRLRQVGRAGHGPLSRGLPRVAVVRRHVADDVAADVVALLSGPARLHLHGDGPGGRPVVPGDVAVLVRTNEQGGLVRDALALAGVPVVLAGGGSVYATDSARSWLVLLEALEQPHRPGRVRAAALTVFLGRSEAELDAAGDEPVDRLGARLRHWAELLTDRGLAAMFEVLCAEEQLPARVLGRVDGDRLLTDLRHLAQSLHAAALRDALGLTALVEWLRRRIAQAAVEGADDRSRRLESDAAAVQVMTVHVSKGLQFPVVHVPYGWHRWSADRPALLRLHDDDGQRVLDVGGSRAPGYRAALARHQAEESGEELRLLYVALTRAQCQVVAHWAPTANTPTAPLHRLLFGAAGAGAQPAARVEVPSDDEAAVALAAVAAASQGRISAETVARSLPPTRWDAPDRPVPGRSVSRLTRPLDTDWRRTSYSGLTRGAHEARYAVAGTPPDGEPDKGVGSEPEDTGTVDEPDLDSGGAGWLDPAPPASPRVPMADLPGGTTFGTLVHEVLEDLDPTVLPGRCRAAVARRGGQGPDPAALAEALLPVLHTPLGDRGTTLAQIPPPDRLAELAFELPLAGGERASSASHATLREVGGLLRRHDLGAFAGYPDRLDGLEPHALRGFLTGSIDLLLRLPGPSYVVVDHKTNRLGDTEWHYRPAAMMQEMLASHYVLQALLYEVAVHRFLRWRQPGYDPARHLGGVLYLFLRGMTGPDGSPGAGVLDWRPSPELVVELSDLLAGPG